MSDGVCVKCGKICSPGWFREENGIVKSFCRKHYYNGKAGLIDPIILRNKPIPKHIINEENYRDWRAGLAYRAKDGSYVPDQGFGPLGKYQGV